MSIEQNKAIALEMLKYLSENKFDKMFELLHDDLTWTVMVDSTLFPAQVTYNKEEQRALLEGLSALAPNGIPLTVKGITAEGTRVAVEAISNTVLANGKPYRNHYHFLFELKDGKVIIAHEYTDTLLAVNAFS